MGGAERGKGRAPGSAPRWQHRSRSNFNPHNPHTRARTRGPKHTRLRGQPEPTPGPPGSGERGRPPPSPRRSLAPLLPRGTLARPQRGKPTPHPPVQNNLSHPTAHRPQHQARDPNPSHTWAGSDTVQIQQYHVRDQGCVRETFNTIPERRHTSLRWMQTSTARTPHSLQKTSERVSVDHRNMHTRQHQNSWPPTSELRLDTATSVTADAGLTPPAKHPLAPHPCKCHIPAFRV